MSDWISGREAKMALKKGTTWRTAVAVGAGDGVYIVSESFGDKAPKMLDDDSLGQYDVSEVYRMSEALTGSSFEAYARFQGLDVALALVLGTAGTPTDEGSSVYSNVYYPANNIDDLFATIVMKKANTTEGIWEIPSAKLHGFNLSAKIGELSKYVFNFAGNKIETDATARVNNSTTLAAVTYPTTAAGQTKSIMRMDSNFAIWMNAQSGVALSSSDAIYPLGFELVYNRPMDEPYSAGNFTMDEPQQDGFAEATLTLNFDKYNLDTFMQAIEDETDMKCLIKFVGGEAGTTGSGSNFFHHIYMPSIKIMTGAAPVSGPGKVGHTVTCRLMAASSAPLGMTSSDAVGIDVTTPLAIHVQNERNSDPLS